MYNILNKKKILLICTTGLLCFGILSFTSPYTAVAIDTPDQDRDGIADVDDNCPNIGNPLQHDIDGDGIGIVCDNQNDQDNDGITDTDDNCPDVANPKQYDLDGDGVGIVCDNQGPDQDNDGVTDAVDNCPDIANPKQYDLDHDGIGLSCDDDTIDNQTAINRSLRFEEKTMVARNRAIGFETKAMNVRIRYIAYETNAMAALARQWAAMIRTRQTEMRQRNLPGPTVGCKGCHSNILSGVRQIDGPNGDFAMNSHHVKGTVLSIDCLACHYTGDHKSGIVKLVDPDQGIDIIYEYDPAAPEELESFCLNCHDSDGSAAGLWNKPFSDELEVPNIKGLAGNMWIDSAHANIPHPINNSSPITCLGDGEVTGCHSNAHGSETYKILAADSSTSMDQICNTCHNLYLYTHHPIGIQFDENDVELVSAVGFTVQCTTCHNPHVVTGMVTDMENQLSPTTTHDFDTDPATNPYGMGATLDYNYHSSLCLSCHLK